MNYIICIAGLSVLMYRNVVLTASRPDYGQLPGTTYCLKVYQAALTSVEIQAVASSCVAGTVSYKNFIIL